MKKFLPVLYVIVVAFIVWILFATGVFGKKDKDLSGYRAVFLTNGQVYFGKTSGWGGQYLTLRDIYYLQVQQPVQPAQENKQQQNQVQLIKLGNEIHAPADEMKINRDQILFIEDLKKNGQVFQAIDKFKQGGGVQAPASPTTTK